MCQNASQPALRQISIHWTGHLGVKRGKTMSGAAYPWSKETRSTLNNKTGWYGKR